MKNSAYKWSLSRICTKWWPTKVNQLRNFHNLPFGTGLTWKPVSCNITFFVRRSLKWDIIKKDTTAKCLLGSTPGPAQILSWTLFLRDTSFCTRLVQKLRWWMRVLWRTLFKNEKKSLILLHKQKVILFHSVEKVSIQYRNTCYKWMANFAVTVLLYYIGSYLVIIYFFLEIKSCL